MGIPTGFYFTFHGKSWMPGKKKVNVHFTSFSLSQQKTQKTTKVPIQSFVTFIAKEQIHEDTKDDQSRACSGKPLLLKISQ